MKIKLICYMGCDHGYNLIFHFLDHYYRLGVEQFLIILHSHRNETRKQDVLKLLDKYHIKPVMEVKEYSSILRRTRINFVMDKYCDEKDWVIHADLDEFQVYPDSLRSFLEHCDEQGFVFVKGELTDRIAHNGKLYTIKKLPSIWEQFPYTSCFGTKLFNRWNKKVCAMKGFLRMGDGGSHSLFYGKEAKENYKITHDHDNNRGFPMYIKIHHFKWDNLLKQRIANKIKMRQGDIDFRHSTTFKHEFVKMVEYFKIYRNINVEELKDLQLSGIPHIHYEREPKNRSYFLNSLLFVRGKIMDMKGGIKIINKIYDGIFALLFSLLDVICIYLNK